MGLFNLRRLTGRRGRRWLLSFSILLLLIALPIAFLGLRARAVPLALPIFRSIAQSRVQHLVHEVAEEIIAKEEYGAICALTYASDGTVQSLWVDSVAANQLVADLTRALEERLDAISLTCKVRSGDILFPKLFSGSGFSITVRGSLYGGASAHLVSDLIEGGINHTLHRIEVEVTIPLTLTVMGDAEQFNLTSRILLGEAVIVGTIPGVVVEGTPNH